jgi:hypothetical protein
MGRNNQQRRAEKKRRRSERSDGRPAGNRPAWGLAPEDMLDREVSILVFAAVTAAGAADHEELDAIVSAIAAATASHGRGKVIPRIGAKFVEVLDIVWEGGWQPSEVAREIGRSCGAAAVGAVTAAMGARGAWASADGAPMPEAWARQLDELGVCRIDGPGDDWILRAAAGGGGGDLRATVRAVIEALAVLMTLPDIEVLVPPPSQWAAYQGLACATRVDDPVLAKVRALLAKAESTTFEAESEALTAKAQELMARHAIDEALARDRGERSERPMTRRLPVDDPYASAKSHLLQVVAESNGVRCVWYGTFAMMAVVGFEADLDAVEVLFTSLLVQGSREMLARGSVVDRYGRSRTRSFRQSFFLAFAGRIRERLLAASSYARQAAEGELTTSLLPVLARRDEEVGEALRAAFPTLHQVAGPRVTNEDGWRAGRTAAELATLGPEQAMIPGMAATA